MNKIQTELASNPIQSSNRHVVVSGMLWSTSNETLQVTGIADSQVLLYLQYLLIKEYTK
jgi:hypothetical protein